MKKVFAKSNLSLQAAMMMLIAPLFIALVVAIMYLSSEMKNVYEDSEDLFYESLYQINSNLINADRDFYQSMLAVTEYYDNINSDHVRNDPALRATIEAKIKDYEDNRQQAIDNVEKAAQIAKNDPDVWTGTRAADGSTFSVLFDEYETAIKAWVFRADMDGGEWSNFNVDFETARGYLSDMSDIVEAWAEKKDAAMDSQIGRTIMMIMIVFAVVVILLFLLAFTTARSLSKGIVRVAGSIDVMADGDFVTVIDVDSPIKEFRGIASAAEGMRKGLQTALSNVITSANGVNEGAESTKEMIADSQKTTADINQAVMDLANGATSMAGDVQSTSDVAIDIGVSVDSVLASATDNMERSEKVEEESKGVQKQLLELLDAGKNTQTKAEQVSDSVNETAKVVEEISRAAEAIIAIASQTNLLALNASIEAARAGEAGKGFAVVADNIKGLAEESNTAANEITGMLSKIMEMSNRNKELTDDIRKATEQEASALEQMKDAFTNMGQVLGETREGNESIVSLVESLNQNKNSITDAVESLSSVSEEYAASTEETSASLTQLETNMVNVVEQAEQLLEIAGDLKNAVSRFKV